tara:strand:+ start:362 stop:856 length:495 start_codon:yes stop_codon:yes gene_type:complete
MDFLFIWLNISVKNRKGIRKFIMARKKTTTKKATAKKAATKKVTKKEQLEGMQVADGKTNDDLDKIRDLEKIMGVHQINPFKTNTLAVFQENLADMNLTDMQRLAVKAGLLPSGNRTTLKNKLLKEFKARTQGGKGSSVMVTRPIVDPDSPEGIKLAKLMKKGF